MSNILIDFTEELFSEMRISSHIVSLPLQWDDQFDLGLRKTLTGKSDFLPQETFADIAGTHSGIGVAYDVHCRSAGGNGSGVCGTGDVYA